MKVVSLRYDGKLAVEQMADLGVAEYMWAQGVKVVEVRHLLVV